jgi:hypothetical protein
LLVLVLLTHKSTAKCAGRGFARQGAGAPWRGKNKDPSRLDLVSGISSVCFYTHPPARPRRNRLPPNSKAGVMVFYFKALPVKTIQIFLNAILFVTSFLGSRGIVGKLNVKAVSVEEQYC